MCLMCAATTPSLLGHASARRRRYLNRINQRKSRARRKARKLQLEQQQTWLKHQLFNMRGRLAEMDAELFSEAQVDTMLAQGGAPALLHVPAVQAQLASVQGMYKAGPVAAPVLAACEPPSLPAGHSAPAKPLVQHGSFTAASATQAAAAQTQKDARSTIDSLSGSWGQAGLPFKAPAPLPPPSHTGSKGAGLSDYSAGSLPFLHSQTVPTFPPMSGYSLGSEDDTSGAWSGPPLQGLAGQLPSQLADATDHLGDTGDLGRGFLAMPVDDTSSPLVQ